MNLSGFKGGKQWLWLALALFVLVGLLLALRGGGTGASTAGSQEKRIAEVLSAMAGAGRVEVALFYEQQQSGAFMENASQKPTGAVVVAQGAEDLAVRLNLIRAVKTLLGLPESAVDVFVMEEER
ncbi:MAG: hypothetical protein RSE58_00570 [Clostridia bacterium]